jgi:serine phosphatase RsbU (regulator of sigma subunit)
MLTRTGGKPELPEQAPSGGEGLALPRALFVGRSVPPRAPSLETAVDLTVVRPEEAAAALVAAAPEVLLLDGSLPLAELEALVETLEPSPSRPAVLVLASREQQACLTRLFDGRIDDFADAVGTDGELLGRLRNALRVRGYLKELNRKNGELARLYERVELLAHRMAEELRLAANIQRSLLPAPLAHPRLEVAREFMPFREIGGDFYDLVPLGPNRIALAIGDVMGKGVPAALLAANLKACLRAQLQAGDVAGDAVVSRVNQLFIEVSPRGLFASFFLGLFDLDKGRLDFVNAGHDYPFLVRPDGAVADLVEGGPVLGLLAEARYSQGSVAIQAGDLAVFYSDGVTDRSNAEGDVFGVERLKEAAGRSRVDGARITLYTLLGEVQGWSCGRPAEDDMTLVVTKVR